MKRNRIDSTSLAVEVAGASARQITPPPNVSLSAADLVFFANVIDEFARVEWTAHQIELAALLARTMSDLEQEQRELRIEGSVLKTDRGTPVVNPRKSVIQMHAGTILSFRRSLSLHARAQGGETRDIAKRREQAKETEIGDLDDLLARPN